MKDLWLTYDVSDTNKSYITILENCQTDKDKHGNMIIKGGKNVAITLDELKTVAKIFNDAIASIEGSNE